MPHSKKSPQKKSSPQRQKTPKKSKRPLWAGLSLILLLLVAVLSYLIYFNLFAPSDKNKHILIVNQGDTYQSLFVAQSWYDTPWHSPIIARVYLKLHTPKPLHAGVYQIPAQASLHDALSILEQGAKSALIKIQIIEGKTTKDLYQTIKNNPNIQLELLTPKQDNYRWHDVAIDNQKVAKALGIKAFANNPEGWFAPDTYYYAQGTSDTKILTDLYQLQQKRLNQAWEQRDNHLPYQTPEQMLIMASIIEKETGNADERNMVAAVFVNRLRLNMRLQTDPTIIYGLFDRYDGKIYRRDIDEKTDYNTYQMHGLPPTPIALPSIKAIKAAAHPANTDVLYFVATGKGGHTFSRTLDEHNKAVAQYRQTLKQAK